MTFINPDAVLAHMVGDYVAQSHWMATEKVKRSIAALAHVAVYGLCFLPLTRNPVALAFIVGTHFAIDRWRLARMVVWAKNWIAPTPNLPWSDCSATGYAPDTPPWLSVWLLVIADNVMHISLNAVALQAWP